MSTVIRRGIEHSDEHSDERSDECKRGVEAEQIAHRVISLPPSNHTLEVIQYGIGTVKVH
jgi:hypothetical protein